MRRAKPIFAVSKLKKLVQSNTFNRDEINGTRKIDVEALIEKKASESR